MLSTASEQYLLQRELTDRSLDAAKSAWRRGRPTLMTATLSELMVLAAQEAEDGLEAVLDQQSIEAPTVAVVNASMFGRQAADGRELAGLLEQATTLVALQTMAVTQVSDTWRSATGSSLAARPAITGYVRHVGAACCSRCAILSGRFYRWSAGFLRHPRCRCINVPTTKADMGSVAETPEELFRQGRITGLSAADTRAIADGADINQVVNAYRRNAGMQFSGTPAVKTDARGLKYTTEGTTKRARAAQQQLGLRRNGRSQARLMPESIYTRANGDHDEAIRLLKLYGWITDDAAIARGRTILAEQRRVAKNARAHERRASSAAA